MRGILACLGSQVPSMFVTVDLWRQTVISVDPTLFADEQVMVWVRLAENVPVMVIESKRRFYKEEIGVINEFSRYLVSADPLFIRPGDHVCYGGESHFISEIETQAGITKAKIEQQKSAFIMPARTDPTYRILGMRARIA